MQLTTEAMQAVAMVELNTLPPEFGHFPSPDHKVSLVAIQVEGFCLKCLSTPALLRVLLDGERQKPLEFSIETAKNFI